MKENTDNGLYLMLGEIKGDIRSVLNRMDMLNKTQAEHKADTDEKLSDHGDRLKALEAFRWKIAGIAVTIPVILTVIGMYVKVMF